MPDWTGIINSTDAGPITLPGAPPAAPPAAANDTSQQPADTTRQPLTVKGVAAARDAGYSDRDIAVAVAKDKGLDLPAVLKAGYDYSDFVSALTAPAPTSEPEGEKESGVLGSLKSFGAGLATIGEATKRGIGAAFEAAEAPTPNIAIGPNDPQQPDDSLLKEAYSVKTPGSAANVGQQWAREAAKDIAANKPNMDEGSAADIAYDVGAGFATFAHILVLGAITKNAALPVYLMGAEGYNEAYSTAIEHGRSETQARQDAGASGALNAAIGSVPMGILMKEGGSLLPSIAKSAGAMGVMNMATDVVQTAYDKNVINPSMTWSEAWPRIYKSGIVGVITGAAFGGIHHVLEGPARVAAASPGDESGVTDKDFEDQINQPAAADQKIVGDIDAQPDIDSAINVAKDAAEGKTDEAPASPQTDKIAAKVDAIDDGVRAASQDKIKTLALNMNDGTAEQLPDGTVNYTPKGEDTPVAMRPWDMQTAAPDGSTVKTETAQNISDFYKKEHGVDVVWVEDPGKNVPFEGAVDPNQPNTIFLSNNPDRAVTSIVLHELGHLTESIVLPETKAADGTVIPSQTMGNVMNEVVFDNLNAPGWKDAMDIHASTAPKRDAVDGAGAPRYAPGVNGDIDHARDIAAHVVNEIAKDTLGEAPLHNGFTELVINKVADVVTERHGEEAAKTMMQQFMDGIKATMVKLRDLFFADNNTKTYAQKRFNNLDAVLNVAAEAYARRWVGDFERIGAKPVEVAPEAQTPASRVLTPVAQDFLAKVDAGGVPGMMTNGLRAIAADHDIPVTRDTTPTDVVQALRDKVIDAAVPASGAPEDVAAKAAFVDNGTPPAVDNRDATHPLGQAYAEARTRAASYAQWIKDFDAQRREAAKTSEPVKVLQQAHDTILGKVGGDESRLTNKAASRLADIRAQLDARLNPVGDSPDMARAREAMVAEHQKMADLASVSKLPDGGVQFSPRQIETPEFKDWFGESKVVDESNAPKVLYHGTKDDVSSFDLDHPNRKDAGWLGRGVYLFDRPDAADIYAGQKASASGEKTSDAAGQNIMPLYASLQNPYRATLADKQKLMHIEHAQGNKAARVASAEWTKKLQAEGYDGVVFEGTGVGWKNAPTEYVVFDPTSVKSAIGNNGDFNPADNRVVFSPRQSTEALRKANADEAARDDQGHALPSRLPTSEKVKVDIRDADMTPDMETLKKNPEQFKKAVDAVGAEPGMIPKGMTFKTVSDKAEYLVNRMRDNLLWLHDKVPSGIRERSKLWYDGAQAIAKNWSGKWGVTRAQAAGMLATLSPQKDWFMNTTMAERVGDILHTQMDHLWDKSMTASAFRFLIGETKTSAKNQAAFDFAKNKTLAEVVKSGDKRAAGIWIRAYDEAHHAAAHAVITPEGHFSHNVMTAAGEEARRAWGDFTAIGKAASIFVDGRMENISANIGAEHKVRNFFNNIFNAADKRFATIDTHAVAADLMRPLASKDKAVGDNFGATGGDNATGINGSYPLHLEAYRRAAEARGILPREMQSITWEAVRGLFPEGFKNQANKDAVNEIWHQVSGGKLTVEQARDQIHELAGGIHNPDWHGDNNVEYRDKSYAQERGTHPGRRITFEVAPNPANTKLKARWDNLSFDEKIRVSHDIAWDVAKQALEKFSAANGGRDVPIKGELHEQLGGREDSTNPSLSIWLDPSVSAGQAMDLARVLGHALDQAGMMFSSPTKFKGGDRMGAIHVELGSHDSPEEVQKTFMKLREIRGEDGNPLIMGHTTVDGDMIILYGQGVEEARVLARRIAEETDLPYNVTTSELFAAFPKKGENDYALSGRQAAVGDGAESSVRALADQLRGDASRQLEEAVAAHEKAATGEVEQSPRVPPEVLRRIDERHGYETPPKVREGGDAEPVRETPPAPKPASEAPKLSRAESEPIGTLEEELTRAGLSGEIPAEETAAMGADETKALSVEISPETKARIENSARNLAVRYTEGDGKTIWRAGNGEQTRALRNAPQMITVDKIVDNDPQRAILIAMGVEHPPKDTLATFFMFELERRAQAAGDKELENLLYTSRLNKAATEAGRVVQSFSTRDPLAANAIKATVERDRENAAVEAVKNTHGDLPTAKKAETAAADTEMKKAIKAQMTKRPPPLEDFKNLVNSLMCR